MVITPEFVERMGTPADRVDSLLEGSEKTFMDYLEGNVFVYVIDSVEEDEDHGIAEGDAIGGYYGTDFKDNGLLDASTDFIDSEVED